MGGAEGQELWGLQHQAGSSLGSAPETPQLRGWGLCWRSSTPAAPAPAPPKRGAGPAEGLSPPLGQRRRRDPQHRGCCWGATARLHGSWADGVPHPGERLGGWRGPGRAKWAVPIPAQTRPCRSLRGWRESWNHRMLWAGRGHSRSSRSLPREAVAAPSLAVSKARLDGALSTLGWWKGSLLMAGGLEPDEL